MSADDVVYSEIVQCGGGNALTDEYRIEVTRREVGFRWTLLSRRWDPLDPSGRVWSETYGESPSSEMAIADAKRAWAGHLRHEAEWQECRQAQPRVPFEQWKRERSPLTPPAWVDGA